MLEDIIDASQFALDQVQGKTLADYESDRALRYSEERSFEVIGEALNRLQRIDPETAMKISAIGDIIGFRNRIAHGYDDIRHDVVWNTRQESVPTLLREATALLPDFDLSS